jgi:hypothetical protein
VVGRDTDDFEDDAWGEVAEDTAPADDRWVDSAEARRPGLGDALRGIGLALGAGGLIALAAIGTVVALLVVSLGPSHRRGPGDGRHSRRLPIEIAPSDGILDGSAVRVRASRLAGAGEAVIAMCAVEADRASRGVAACDLAHRSQVKVHQGKVLASFRVSRSIPLQDGSRVNCGDGPGRCVLMVASVENYDRSGFAPLMFLAGPG